MRVVIDMNLSPAWTAIFAHRGVTAIHWSEIGRKDATDREIFDWARANDYVVFTHDLDFGMILAASRFPKPSVVQVRDPNVNPHRSGERIVEIFKQYAAELERGALLNVEPANARVRLLPIH